MQSAKPPESVVAPATRPVNTAPTATEGQEEDEDPNPTIPEEHAYNELKSLISKHDRWLTSASSVIATNWPQSNHS